MRYLKILALLIFIAILLIFFQQNTEILNTGLQFQLDIFGNVWRSLQTPLYFVLVAAFFLGGVLTLLYFFIEKLRLAKQLRACRSQIGKLEQEVNSLRNLPLQETYPAVSEESYAASPESKAESGT
ncbi:lipopolysaccharide assembly protein LapA domain-containing protein [Desulfocurvibacter africanus]|uniref:Lipopolysaccharide assembly protein A domain-containing protein n=1 Tax=Desulfocurvibacter africanus subsp. africanus str. Walvis Bay TaxID=690850 RepID=F3Z2K4_DESAF|nr:LapA family protein [Desulfocurvibacter africanus]EGJ51337.1 hypothetical protein Desaf_3038 [Desulfocurvibacter africanus subsp. africanus str. Walvis Bay]